MAAVLAFSRPASNVAAIFRQPERPSALRRPFFDSPAAQMGFPSTAADYVESELDLNEYLVRNKPATFFIRLQGDSLEGLGMLDGDVAAVDRSVSPAPGKVVIASVDGEIVAKVYEVVDGRAALSSKNDRIRYPVRFLDTYESVVVWGCVTSMVRRL